MGKNTSHKTKDIWGNTVIEHRDSRGRTVRTSHQKKDMWGNTYIQHYGKNGAENGKSRKKEDTWGNTYTQHYNHRGIESGKSRTKTGYLGNRYTEHSDTRGNVTGKTEHNDYGSMFGAPAGRRQKSTHSKQAHSKNYTKRNSYTQRSTSTSYHGSFSPTAANPSSSKSRTPALKVFAYIIFVIGIIASLADAIFMGSSDPYMPTAYFVLFSFAFFTFIQAMGIDEVNPAQFIWGIFHIFIWTTACYVSGEWDFASGLGISFVATIGAYIVGAVLGFGFSVVRSSLIKKGRREQK